jgi:hypothetical protein
LKSAVSSAPAFAQRTLSALVRHFAAQVGRAPLEASRVLDFSTKTEDAEGQEVGDPHLLDHDALKALVFVLRLALDRSSGRPLSRGFLDFLRTEFKKDGSNTHSRIALP